MNNALTAHYVISQEYVFVYPYLIGYRRILWLRVCAEINSQIFVSRRMPDKARKLRNIEIFRASATMSGVMHSPPKCEVIFAWALREITYESF